MQVGRTEIKEEKKEKIGTLDTTPWIQQTERGEKKEGARVSFPRKGSRTGGAVGKMGW